MTLRVLSIVALLLASLAPGDVRAGELEGEWIVFHGWCPDSRCYAYSVAEIRRLRGRERRHDEHRLVRLGRRGRPRVERYRSERAMLRAAKTHLVAAMAVAERPDDGAVVFPFVDGRELRFRVVADDRLSYTVALHDAGSATEIGAGVYDDLYAETDAYAYLSPDRKKVALLVYGQLATRVKGEVHFLRLPNAMAEGGVREPPPEPVPEAFPEPEPPRAPRETPRPSPIRGMGKLTR